jgi:hypothetical protein
MRRMPVPPSPTVFAQALTMTFEAQAYTPERRVSDEYELEQDPFTQDRKNVHRAAGQSP